METIYTAWFKDGSTITKDSLDEAIKLSYFEYIIKSTPIKTCSKGYIQCKYDFFDKNGNSTKVKVNNFELIDITESSYNSYDKTIILFDTHRAEFFKININGGINSVFTKWVVGLLNNINDLGSFEVYQILEENEKLKKEIENVRKLVSEKNGIIIDLEKQIKDLKDPNSII
jgi:hypothetical protein